MAAAIIGLYETSIRQNTQIPIVASSANNNGLVNLYFVTVNDIRSGDVLKVTSTVQYSSLGRNFPIFAAGRIRIATQIGDYGAPATPEHGVDLSAPDHNPYAILPHIGAWTAGQDYPWAWVIVWGWARSRGNEGQSVDVLDQGRLDVMHLRG